MKTTKSLGSQSWISEFGPTCCGRITGLDADGSPLVNFTGNAGSPLKARFIDSAGLDGRTSLESLEVLLVFEHGDPSLPIIVGVLGGAPLKSKKAVDTRPVMLDRQRLVLAADEEITLVSGKSSITLAKDGRITLRGVEIVSQASRANKIRGASVNIN